MAFDYPLYHFHKLSSASTLEERDIALSKDLFHSLWSGHYESSQFLLQQGANPSTFHKNLAIDTVPLCIVAERNWTRGLELIASFNPVTPRHEALWRAGIRGGTRAFHWLLHHRIFQTTLDPLASATGAHSLMMMACARGQTATVRSLLKIGFNVHVLGEKQRQPIHEAAYTGNIALLRLLIESGANVHSQDEDGNTPAHSAAFTQSADALRFLARQGAVLTAKNFNGEEPIHWALASYYSNGGTSYNKALRFLAVRGGSLDDPLAALNVINAARDKGGMELVHFLEAELAHRERRSLHLDFSNSPDPLSGAFKAKPRI